MTSVLAAQDEILLASLPNIPMLSVGNAIQQSGMLDDFLNLNAKFAACENLLKQQRENGQLDQTNSTVALANLRHLRILFLRLAVTTADFDHWLDTLSQSQKANKPARPIRSYAENLNKHKFRTINSVKSKNSHRV
jgi:hypothetical protein